MIGVLALLGTFLDVSPATAVYNGEPDDADWAAYIEIDEGTCSGALVGYNTVLTAAHCVIDNNAVVSPEKISVWLGRRDPQNPGTRFAVTEVFTHGYQEIGGFWDNDVALLRLDRDASVQPLWMSPDERVAVDGTPLVLHGYGRTSADGQPTDVGTLYRTRPGTNSVNTGCWIANNGRMCSLGNNESSGRGGDSGGAWTTVMAGNPLLIMVFTGYAQGDAYGEGVANADVRRWIRTIAGVPNAVPGTVVSDVSTGARWLIDELGFRRSITDPACVMVNNVQQTRLRTYEIALIPTLGATAVCPSAAKSVIAWGNDNFGHLNVPQGLTATAVAAGLHHALAVRADGTVAAWGANFYGERSVPAGLTDVTAVEAGDLHSLALRGDGSVVAWGADPYGETHIPATVHNVVALSVNPTGRYSLALRSDGTVVAWGSNFAGETTVPQGLAGVRAVAAGARHALALRADGTVSAWGRNDFGQATVPAGLNNVVAVSAGSDSSLALRSDGTVVEWGAHNYWQYGAERTVPAVSPADLHDVVAISTGAYHNVAVLTDGSTRVWGANTGGQTTPPPTSAPLSAADAGGTFSVALVR